MTIIGKILRGVAGVGLSVFGLVGLQPGLAATGGTLLSSIFSAKVTTDVQGAAQQAEAARQAYMAATNPNIYTKVGNSVIPTWAYYLGGGLVIALIVALFKRSR